MKTDNGTGLDSTQLLRTFDRLPEHIRDLAAQLAVKQMHVEVMAKRLEEESASLQARRNDLEVAITDLDIFKAELRDKCREYVKTNL